MQSLKGYFSSRKSKCPKFIRLKELPSTKMVKRWSFMTQMRLNLPHWGRNVTILWSSKLTFRGDGPKFQHLFHAGNVFLYHCHGIMTLRRKISRTVGSSVLSHGSGVNEWRISRHSIWI